MNDFLKNAIKTLHLGQVVAHPTETCYGLAVDIFQKSAVERLYKLKKMPFSKPVSVLVESLDEAIRYGEFSEKAIELAKEYWPGPLTIIVPRKSSLPVWINPGMDSVGFRVSSNKKAKELQKAFGGPLTTTSANISGEASPYNVQEVLDQGLVPDFVIDGGQLARQNQPSTIVKVDGAEVFVLREGTIKEL